MLLDSTALDELEYVTNEKFVIEKKPLDWIPIRPLLLKQLLRFFYSFDGHRHQIHHELINLIIKFNLNWPPFKGSI